MGGYPDVAGICPACGKRSLFLADGGHVTCRRAECFNPCAADDALHRAPIGESPGGEGEEWCMKDCGCILRAGHAGACDLTGPLPQPGCKCSACDGVS